MPKRGIHAFIRDDRGTGTLEFVLWVPVVVFILLAVVDATVLYLHHTEMWNISRDVARRIAVGEITEAEAEETIKESLFLASDEYFIRTSNPKYLDVQVSIQTRVSDASVFGIYEPVLGRHLAAYVRTRREPI